VGHGKRTDRLKLPSQLRTDAEMGITVRNLAMLNRRTIQQELLVLIESGLKVQNVASCQLVSPDVTAKKETQ